MAPPYLIDCLCYILGRLRPYHEVGLGRMGYLLPSHYRILVLRNGVLPF